MGIINNIEFTLSAMDIFQYFLTGFVVLCIGIILWEVIKLISSMFKKK